MITTSSNCHVGINYVSGAANFLTFMYFMRKGLMIQEAYLKYSSLNLTWYSHTPWAA